MASLEQTARKAGVELVTVEGRVEARQGAKVIAFHTTPERALAKALERIEEDRLRKLPYDQEIILKPRPRRAPPVRAAAPAIVVPISLVEALPLPASLALVPLSPEPLLPTRQIKGSIIKTKYKDRYKKNGGSCGDEIAEELTAYVVVFDRGKARLDLKRVREVAEVNGLWKDSYSKLNPGQLRMTIGNRLRVKRATGDQINIGGAVFMTEIVV